MKIPHVVALILTLILTAAEGIQQYVISMPAWVHVLVGSTILVLTGMGIVPDIFPSAPVVETPPTPAATIATSRISNENLK